MKSTATINNPAQDYPDRFGWSNNTREYSKRPIAVEVRFVLSRTPFRALPAAAHLPPIVPNGRGVCIASDHEPPAPCRFPFNRIERSWKRTATRNDLPSRPRPWEMLPFRPSGFLKAQGVEPAVKSSPYLYSVESPAALKLEPERTPEEAAALAEQKQACALRASLESARKRASKREAGRQSPTVAYESSSPVEAGVSAMSEQVNPPLGSIVA